MKRSSNISKKCQFFFKSDHSKVRISCQKVDDEGGFCIVVDLENCDDMLYWLLACKITFACYLQDCEQKNNHVPPSEF